MSEAELIVRLRRQAGGLERRRAEYVEHLLATPADNEAIDAAETMRAAANALAREGEMRRVLDTYQWAFHNYSGFKCPCCNKAKSYGHDEACAIKTALASPAPSSGEEKRCFECGHDLNGPYCPKCNPIHGSSAHAKI